MIRMQYVTVVILMAALSLSGGCAGYQLGSTLPPEISSIYVPTFVNETKEPFLETTTTQAAIQEFQRDGTLKIATRTTADVMAEVILTKFELQPLRYQRDKALTTEEYRMRIHATLTLTSLKSGLEVAMERSVMGEGTFALVGDMSSSKQTALPEVTRDLAHHIVQEIVEYW